MGIIQRQGLKRSIVAYAATVLGAVSTIFIYPRAFEAYGELRFVVAVAVFIYPLISLGIGGLAVRFFPEFNDDKDRGLLPLMLLSFLICFGVFGTIVFFNQPTVTRFFEFINFNPKLFQENASLIVILTLFVGLSEMLKRYTTNFGRVVVPEIISNIGLKFVMPIFVLAIYLNYASLMSMKWLLILVYAVVTGSLLLYLHSLKGLTFKIDTAFLTRERTKRMAGYSLYGLLGSVGSVMAFQIDSIMVAGMDTSYAAGQYFNALNIASFISVPQVAISAIAGPIISAAIFHDRWDEVEDLYRQSSLNLCIVGAMVYLMIIVNLNDLFLISTNTEGMQALYWPVVILGGAKVLDMASGMNREIMGYSHLYVSNLGIVLLLAVTNVIANYLLIPVYGLIGAAIATFGSLFLVNLIRFVFLWAKQGIQPFTRSHVELVLIAALCWAIIFLMPDTPYALINIALKCGVVALVILFANYRRGWSPLINDFLLKYIGILKAFVQR